MIVSAMTREDVLAADCGWSDELLTAKFDQDTASEFERGRYKYKT
jgi:hypothetical protein